MSGADLHLQLNHFPIILSLVGAAAALLAVLTRRRAVWLYATATLALAGLTAYPTMLTGHQAEHAIEDAWYVSRDAIHEHEERGEVSTYIMLVAGALAAYAWWRATRAATRDEVPPLWLRAAVVVGGITGAAAIGYTSYAGGFIVHKASGLMTAPPGAAAAPVPPATR